MIDFHPEDLDAIRRVTGWKEMSDRCRRTYDQWIRMKHRAGYPGKLGDLVVPFLWSMGARAKEEPERSPRINWSELEIGTDVNVYDNGVLRPGTFAGMLPGGTLSVRIQGDPVVREFNHSVVSVPKSEISSDIDIESMRGGVEEEPDGRLNFYNAQEREADNEIYDEAEVPEKDMFNVKAVDAGLFVKGDELMVEIDGVVYDATFVNRGDAEGKVVVDLGDQGQKTVGLDQVSV